MTSEARRPLVLAVDDELQILTSIDDLLEDDFEVRTATSGAQGLEALGKDDFAIILTDQRMPGMTGDEFLLEAQRLSAASRILITGYADLNALQRAVNHGKIFAYIPKPWDPAMLRRTIDDAFKHYELIRDMENNRNRKLSFDAAHAGMWSWDIRTNRVVWDTAMARLHGIDPDSFGGNRETWLSLLHPDDRTALTEAAEHAMSGGNDLDVVVRCGVESAQDWRYLHTQAVVVRDEAGRALRLTGLSTDVTERKRSEELLRASAAELARRAARQQLQLHQIVQQSRELEKRARELRAANRELETLAVVAAHDLKEPLRTISFHSSLLEESLGDRMTPEECARLEALRKLVGQLSGMIDALLRYIHLGRTALAVAPTDLNEVAAECVSLLEAALQRGNGRVELRNRLPNVLCDRQLILDVFHNLVANAMKYNARPEKRIEIGVEEASADVPAGKVVIGVHDNGIGIESRYLGRIFEMFRRLHEPGEYGGGDGVGLAWVKRIIDLHGGRIWLDSRPGQGSSFYFTLELTAAQPKPLAGSG